LASTYVLRPSPALCPYFRGREVQTEIECQGVVVVDIQTAENIQEVQQTYILVQIRTERWKLMVTK